MKLRYSLRTMAIILLLFAIFLGGWMNRLRSQRRAITDLESHGGLVAHSVYVDGGIGSRSLFPSWLPGWACAYYPKNITGVYLIGEEFGDQHMKLILAFPELKIIDVSETSISDESLLRLKQYRGLNLLKLRDVKTISESGLKDLQRSLPNCYIVH